MTLRKLLFSYGVSYWNSKIGDGISTLGELTPIAANDIGSIGLSNVNGVNAETIAVGFTADQSNTRFILPDGFEYDPVLKAMVQDLMASYTKPSSCLVHAWAVNDNDISENAWGMVG